MNVAAAAEEPAVRKEDGGMAQTLTMYVGTIGSAQNKSRGIYIVRFDPQTGALSQPELAGEAMRASFVCFHPSGKFLYATDQTTDSAGKNVGAVASFAIDPSTGKLSLLNRQPSGGGGPCFVAVDHTGHALLTANYGSGSVACLPIADDGSLRAPGAVIQHTGTGPDPQRQTGPHAHSFNVDPSNRFALACDLGVDKVFVYRLDPAVGTLARNDPPFATTPPGGGPRHLTFDGSGKFVYVNNEMGGSVNVFSWDAGRGALTLIETVPTLPPDFKELNTTAEVRVHPSQRFVYVSNRGHDSIAIFARDEQTGRLKPAGRVSTQGKTPRNFTFDPAGKYLIAANETTGNIVSFAIDSVTGGLTPTGSTVDVPGPSCLRFFERK